ncbi:RNA pseudouridine synthase [bacterium]|nr:RNA pseudouridine synthase [bacterium]
MRGFEPFEASADPFVAGESRRFVAVFKPAGMHSAPKAGGVSAPRGEEPAAAEPSLLGWFLAQRPEHAAAFAEAGLGGRAAGEAGMLSRLDNETSGLILFARNPEIFAEALAMQEAGRLRKAYRLVAAPAQGQPGLPGSRPFRCAEPRAEGFFPPESGAGMDFLEIESFFRPYGEGRSRVACLADDAAGSFRKERASNMYSTALRRLGPPLPGLLEGREGLFALEAEIRSGFRHQIRAHLAWAGFPILGDGRYGGAPAPRLYLEAHRIEILPEISRPFAEAAAPGEFFELYGGLSGASAASPSPGFRA